MSLKPFILLGALMSLHFSVHSQVYFPTGDTIKVSSANELYVHEDLENNVTLAYITLSGSNAFNITGVGIIENLILNKSAGVATITSGMQTLTGVMTPTAGTLNANGFFTLKSTDSNTASIGQGSDLGGYITGNIIAERYIPATGRRYRMLTPSVNTTGSIKDNWMEGNMNLSSYSNVNSLPGYGTQISGSGGNTNGFDVTGSNEASLYVTSNGTTPGYTSVSNTSGTLSALTGYFLFIRGDRSMNMNLWNTNVAPSPIPLPSSSTTLRATGTVVQGTVTNFSNALSSVAGGLSLITNPYPSAINWASVYAASTNINNYYTYWDPNLGFRGGFTTVRTDGVSSPSSAATNIIQSGQAFFVTTTSGTPTISIQESHKDSLNNVHEIYKANKIIDGIASSKIKGISPSLENNQPNLQPSGASIPSFNISLYYTEASGFKRLTDGALALFDNQYSSSLDNNDAIEVRNWDENIAIMRDGKNISIESRAQLSENDTLEISMSSMKNMNYELKFQGSNFPSSLLQPALIDNFKKNLTPLSLTEPTVVPFTVTSDTATSSKNRFKVIFKTSVVLPFSVTKIKATKKNESAQVDWEVKTDEEINRYEVERSADGRSFVKVATVASLGKGIAVSNYSWVDNNPLIGENYYRIKVIPQVGKEKLSAVAVVIMDENNTSMSVYPNPTEGNNFNMNLNNLKKGTYKLQITDINGQQIFNRTINHQGNTLSQNISLNKVIPNGIYHVKLQGEGQILHSKIIKN